MATGAEADSMDVSADASDAGADAMKWPVKNLRIGLIVAVAVVLQPRSFTRERDKKDKNRKDSRRSRSLTGHFCFVVSWRERIYCENEVGSTLI